MPHPYADLPGAAFWRSGVAEADPTALAGIYTPKVRLAETDRIATAGSCFAQHIGRSLKAAGLGLIDAEPSPPGMAEATARRFGFGLFSARYGNVYTARQMVQLIADATAGTTDPAGVWTREARFYDALRPGTEPEGLASETEVLTLRREHLAAVAGMLAGTDILILTLGLTEAWTSRATGRVYPTCPGVIAGSFDPDHHAFVNFRQSQVLDDLAALRAALRALSPGARMILTVSPVPLTATASGGHVLPATGYSKAVLRAAAGEFAEAHADVDYFPSFEIVTNPAARGRWLAPGAREVTAEGIATVMEAFFAAQGLAPAPESAPAPKAEAADPADDAVCEDILLDAFRP